jgi:hypothetical protein
MVDICYPDGTDWSCAYSDDEFAALDPDIVARSEALSWSTLSALTGYRVSTCPVVLRPCAARCHLQTWDAAPVGDDGVFNPYISNGRWFNGCGCSSAGDCSCTTICQAILPETGAVLEVWLNGAVLDPTAYRVDNGNRLVRTDGDCWPVCQDMNQPAYSADSFAVSMYTGVAPNDLTRYAAGVLASEYYLACSGKECRLPAGVTSITRVGLAMQIEGGSFPSGMTGIPEVDAVIRIYNPFGIKARARALSPDVPRGRFQTWGA